MDRIDKRKLFRDYNTYLKTKETEDVKMDKTKSRYEVISDLETQKRNLIRERDGFDDRIKEAKREIKELERELEDKKEDLEDLKKSIEDRKETIKELIKSVEESLKRMTDLQKSSK